MNNRIKELAEQCGFRSNPDIYDRNQSFNIPLFAELIVKECAIFSMVMTDDHYDVEALYKHFGIDK